MRWLYRLTSNALYPDPIAEVSALAKISEDGTDTWLMLATGKTPPGKRAKPGDTFLLAVADDEAGLLVHAIAPVGGAPELLGKVPQSVTGLYTATEARWFVPLADVELCSPERVPNMTVEEVATFLSGQSYVRKLDKKGQKGSSAGGPPIMPVKPRIQTAEALSAIAPASLPKSNEPFVAVGVDPTAGTWASKMTLGDKRMPSVALQWTDAKLNLVDVGWHSANNELWDRCRRCTPAVVAIDGPCATNGLALLPDWTGWDLQCHGDVRDAEPLLARDGIGLFWTTYATVAKFDGASRWIARSLRLFTDDLGDKAPERIEIHPHAAFTLLWRRLAPGALRLPKKTTGEGRAARLALLRAFIHDLDGGALVDHDAVDAAAAALVAALHMLGLTRAVGTDAGGGRIWVPDVANL